MRRMLHGRLGLAGRGTTHDRSVAQSSVAAVVWYESRSRIVGRLCCSRCSILFAGTSICARKQCRCRMPEVTNLDQPTECVSVQACVGAVRGGWGPGGVLQHDSPDCDAIM